MDAEATISALLSRLSITESNAHTLEELKTLLTVLPKTELRNAIPNISVSCIFKCFNTADSSQQVVAGEILNTMLSTLSASTVLENFHSQLRKWLISPTDPVKSLCLCQITRLSQESPADLAQHQDLILAIVEQMSSTSTEVGLAASKALTHLGKHPDGLHTLFNTPSVVDKLVSCMATNEVVRLRVFQMAIEVCCFSESGLNACAQSGLLQQIVNEALAENDVLVQLNAIELLSDLACCPHGLVFLDRQGVVAKLESLMGGIQDNPMANLMMPGLIKFFGGLANKHPKEVLSKFPRFVGLVFNSICDNDPSQGSNSMDTIGFIGSTPEGKLALDRLGNPMTECVQAIGKAVKQGRDHIKKRALEALASLLYLEVQHQTTELLSLTQRWFEASNSNPLAVILSAAQQPFTDIRVPGLRVLQSIALVPWGQNLLNVSPGFKEYLLDRSTETCKEGKEEKFVVVKILAESPTCIDILSRPYHVKLKEYVNEGPFFVMAQSEVAMEGE